MTCAEIFKAYGELMMDSVDLLLMLLFLKSSQDKRFVCEAAEAALMSMTSWISPSVLLSKLQPYLKHKSPRIRAKASVCFSKSVPWLGFEGIKEYEIDKLIQVTSTQLSDQLHESREVARKLSLDLQAFYQNSQASSSGKGDSSPATSPEAESWEAFCQSKLTKLSAQAILRSTVGVLVSPKEVGKLQQLLLSGMQYGTNIVSFFLSWDLGGCSLQLDPNSTTLISSWDLGKQEDVMKHLSVLQPLLKHGSVSAIFVLIGDQRRMPMQCNWPLNMMWSWRSGFSRGNYLQPHLGIKSSSRECSMAMLVTYNSVQTFQVYFSLFDEAIAATWFELEVKACRQKYGTWYPGTLSKVSEGVTQLIAQEETKTRCGACRSENSLYNTIAYRAFVHVIWQNQIGLGTTVGVQLAKGNIITAYDTATILMDQCCDDIIYEQYSGNGWCHLVYDVVQMFDKWPSWRRGGLALELHARSLQRG